MADIAGEQQTPTPTVAGCAELCLKSFQQCLHKAASVHARELSLTDDQLARFSVWAANIRVFAPSRGSLDYRLREAPDVQDAVIGLLEALNYRVQKCRFILSNETGAKLTRPFRLAHSRASQSRDIARRTASGG